MIRLLLILLIAMALTISWQTTLLAGNRLDTSLLCTEAEDREDSDKKPDSSSEEPECG